MYILYLNYQYLATSINVDQWRIWGGAVIISSLGLCLIVVYWNSFFIDIMQKKILIIQIYIPPFHFEE